MRNSKMGPVEIIEGNINAFKCKYIYLDKLFNGKLDEKKGKCKTVDTVNIYISLESLFNSIRGSHIEKRLEKMDKKESKFVYRQIISNIINVAAHYRKYFTRHKVKTNIIYYFNEIMDEYENYNNSALYANYREHYYNSLHSLDRININNMVQEAIPFLNIITEYIPDIYMISTKHLESSMIPFVCMMEGYLPSNMNIIVSKDEYDLQYCIYNSLVITRYANEPLLLTKRNVMKYLCFRKNYKPERLIHPKLLTFILACIGNRKRGIYSIRRSGFKTIYRQLLSLYDAGYIIDDDEETMKIGSLMHVLNRSSTSLFSTEELATMIISQYQVTDFESQFRAMNNTQKKEIEKQIKNKTDPSALIEINERYFEDCPLELVELNQYSKNRDSDF